MNVAQFTNNTKDSDWENVAERRTITCLCALFKAYSGEWAWQPICNRLRNNTIWVGLVRII